MQLNLLVSLLQDSAATYDETRDSKLYLLSRGSLTLEVTVDEEPYRMPSRNLGRLHLSHVLHQLAE